eukprot:70923-Prymnesium_polylepis.1
MSRTRNVMNGARAVTSVIDSYSSSASTALTRRLISASVVALSPAGVMLSSPATSREQSVNSGDLPSPMRQQKLDPQTDTVTADGFEARLRLKHG